MAIPAKGLSDTCADSLSLLSTGLQRLGARLDAKQSNQFVQYCRLLQAANTVTNLTGVRDSRGIMTTLFLDSLTVAFAGPSPVNGLLARDGSVIVDVGAGAGLPGIPLKIMFPGCRLTSIESIGKKAAFLRDLIEELELHDLGVEQRRAEEVGRDPLFRQRADLCVARAVAPLRTLIELCAPLVSPSGLLALPKSGHIEREIQEAEAAARALGARLERVVTVPENLDLGLNRYIVLYRRTGGISSKFPRRVGLARSHPLGADASPSEHVTRL